MNSLWILLITIPAVVLISRLMAFAVLRWKILPKGLFSIGTRRVHHFVYGNILIVLVALVSVVTTIDSNSWYMALMLGIGLGLVLDEFPHWIGDVTELTRNVAVIPRALTAVIIVELIIGLLLALAYFAPAINIFSSYL